MWQVGVKTATALVGLGERLRKLMTRKGGGSKSGGVNTPELSDSLAKVVKDMLDMMQKLNHDTAQTFTGIPDVMRGLNHRIGVLERAAKKKPRKAVKRTRRT